MQSLLALCFQIKQAGIVCQQMWTGGGGCHGNDGARCIIFYYIILYYVWFIFLLCCYHLAKLYFYNSSLPIKILSIFALTVPMLCCNSRPAANLSILQLLHQNFWLGFSFWSFNSQRNNYLFGMWEPNQKLIAGIAQTG